MLIVDNVMLLFIRVILVLTSVPELQHIKARPPAHVERLKKRITVHSWPRRDEFASATPLSCNRVVISRNSRRDYGEVARLFEAQKGFSTLRSVII